MAFFHLFAYLHKIIDTIIYGEIRDKRIVFSTNIFYYLFLLSNISR